MAQYRVNWGEAPGKDRGDPRLEQAPQEEVLTLTPGGWVPHPLLPSPSYSTPRGGAQHALRSSHSYPATCPTCTLHSSHNYPAACPTCTHISPAPVQTPHLSQVQQLKVCQQRLLRPGPSAWRTTASFVGGLICATSYVRLLCDSNLQQLIDSLYDKQEFRQLPIDAVRSVVVGQRCKLGSCSDLFYCQEPGDSVDAYLSRCCALAAECNFHCPECDNSLTEYVLSRKVIMVLSNIS
ncbi:uncharacterized protein LOC135112270 [Scylla paramamosain]|uniref:uncharacterized protein LOC135112270 n=1 Tax=Scylla paramamosain TaxID=85552 RepID=UPI0030827F14